MEIRYKLYRTKVSILATYIHYIQLLWNKLKSRSPNPFVIKDTFAVIIVKMGKTNMHKCKLVFKKRTQMKNFQTHPG